jgi:hypothetical protein
MLTDQREELTRRRVKTVCRLQALLVLPGQAGRDITALQTEQMLASVRPRDIAGTPRRRIAARELAEPTLAQQQLADGANCCCAPSGLLQRESARKAGLEVQHCSPVRLHGDPCHRLSA